MKSAVNPTYITDPHVVYQKVVQNVEKVMIGQSDTIRKVMAAFASGGHVLLEDYPGTGKTTLAKTLARSIDADFKRIQFTPDLLPSDLLGISIFNQKDQKFHFHKGPIFTNILDSLRPFEKCHFLNLFLCCQSGISYPCFSSRGNRNINPEG